MMFTCQEQSSPLLFTCNFHYSYYSLRIVVIFLLPLFPIPHCTAQMIDSERAGVLLAAVLIIFCLIQNTFVWLLYSMSFHQLICPRCRRVLLAVSGWGKEQRPVSASCVFHRNAMLSSPPSFLICVLLQVRVTSFMYVTSTCTFCSEQQYCD